MSVTDERMQNWRTDRITEYALLESNKKGLERCFDEDTDLNKLRDELRTVLDKIERAEKPHLASIDAVKQQQAGIKLELVDTWGATEEKTFECGVGTATLRTTKSLNIRNKEKLVAFLELNKKLTDFIKSFEITKLRKIKDAGMLEDEICTWDEKKSVAIKMAVADQ